MQQPAHVPLALRAVFQKLGMEAWGHTLTALVGNLPAALAPQPDLIDCAKTLDKHYIPTRYPNGFESGAPTDCYTQEEAQRAIREAEVVLGFCHDQIRQP